ncbi:hypothetical protein [Xanthocytophaga agilis]|uniref:YD repeat-containing protein n=1 Tax=Xanthocytophaga agilis TaxID=3048010 RepID=A0AAE3RCF4_9BACT|nr:hypothetical protein [Xanthocytophaga agilis]MDJ1505192.1 hypothetical protein [Xanthocytophaga agilis]
MIKILLLSPLIRHRKWGLLVFALLTTILVQAQDWQPKVVPPSPNAASLGIFGNVPVSLYTGLPNVTIPIYTIQYRDITLPISLSYHGQGVKVDQEASLVGLNWALMAGGTITRTIRGFDDIMDDNFRIGYPYVTSEVLAAYQETLPIAEGYGYHNQNVLDYTPDIFYYNIGGQSGKFILDKITSPPAGQKITIKGIPLDAQKISITYYSNSTPTVPTNLPGYWEIITADGMKYHFETKEFTFTRRSESGYAGPTGADADCISNNRTLVALEDYYHDYVYPNKDSKQVGSWQLDKITSISGASIDLTYDMESDYASLAPLMRTERNSGSFITSGDGTTTYSSQLITKERLLKQITFGDSKVEFITEDRADIAYVAPFTLSGGQYFTPKIPQRLKQIKISNPSGFTKLFDFGYGYFNEGKSQEFLRLKLVSLLESNEKKHQFMYDERMPLPSKNSFDKDHWGYYNGPWDNYNKALTQMPVMRYQAPTSQNYVLLNPSRNGRENFAIRRPDQGVVDQTSGQKDYPYLKAGILTRVVYPTGGLTNFDYEPNSYEQTYMDDDDDSWHLTTLTQTNGESAVIEIAKPTFAKMTLTGSSQAPISFYNTSERPVFLVPVEGTSGSTIGIGNLTKDCGPTPPGNTDASWQYYCNKINYSTNGYTIQIPAGKYKIVVRDFYSNGSVSSTTDAYLLSLQAVITYLDFDKSATRIGGGLRIKRTSDQADSDVSKAIIRNYSYTTTVYGNNGPEAKSTGLLMSNVVKYCFPVDYTDELNVIYRGYQFYSSTTYPLSSTAQGSTIGYSKVTMSIGANGELGSEIYEYKNESDPIRTPSANNRIIFFPDLPNRDDNNMNGFLQQKTVFENRNGILRILQRMESFYLSSVVKSVTSYKMIGTWKTFTTNSRWQYQTTKKETSYVYDSQGNVKDIVALTNSYSDNPSHYLPTRSETTGSDGKILVSITTYPEDYPAGTPFIDAMKTSFLHALPIETVSYQVNADNTTSILSGQITTYQTACSICKDQTFLLETASPVALANFKFSNRAVGQLPFGNTTATGFAIDNRYQSRISYSYDSFANIRQLSKPSDIPLIYLWGYGHQYPVAEIKNATYQQVLDAIGGQSVVDAIAQSPTIDDYLDDLAKLRTIPKAMVSTYTYLPLIGVKTVGGVDGKTLTYEYDSLQRLRVIRDQKGYIVKQYRYHYQGQPALE